MSAKAATLPTPRELLDVKELGTVREVRTSIARIGGLPSCLLGQLVTFSSGGRGMVIGFTDREVTALMLDKTAQVSTGDRVESRPETFRVPVGQEYVGRVVSPLGAAVDGLGDITTADALPIFGEAAGVMERTPIAEALQTGTLLVDAVIPIGKGQRELIIGDRMTGRTTLALDAILNQHDKRVLCIYCCIGKSTSALQKTIQLLQDRGAMAYTTVVAAPAACSAGEQYLAPYTAATLGEHFMRQGRDVLVVLDDLTKHAWIYRQIALLLGRSPGREAYPGDIFYIHSQLVERAGRLSPEFGGGTMTMLPIVETQQGDVTGLISSYLISMTDGQIYLNSALFYEGFKPAVDVGLSVSRIGNKVQCPALREVSGTLRLEYVQYKELLRLAKLRTGLSQEARARMRRGEALRQIFIQSKHRPKSLVEEIILLYALQRGVLEKLSTPQIAIVQEEFMAFLQRTQPALLETLRGEQILTSSIKEALDKSFMEFAKQRLIAQQKTETTERTE